MEASSPPFHLTSKTVASLCPYSPECVEGEFSELRIRHFLGSCPFLSYLAMRWTRRDGIMLLWTRAQTRKRTSGSGATWSVVGGSMARRIMRWIRKALLWSVGTFLVLALAGALYQLIATEVDERRYPPPGELVDVGGYRLHVHCSGQGSPTVILDHLGKGTSSQWAWVQPEVSDVTRVCAYDRAGFGWSDPGPAPRDALGSARELEILLRNEGGTCDFSLMLSDSAL
jgi:hypothetical protein